MRNFKILLILFLSLGLLVITPKAHAAITDPLTTIELEAPVHFLAPDGSDLMVKAGTYAIEPAEEWIRLMSGERHDAVLIEAQKSTHELELEHTMAMSVPGETEEEADLHHVMLLLPGGQSLDATGTYSGIRHRGFLKNTFNRVKKKANQAYKKAKSTAKKTVSKAKSTVNKAKKHVKKQTQKAVTQGKKSAQNIQKQVRKNTRKAIKTTKTAIQSARNAALHAKRHVERTARKGASHVKSGIRKAKQTVTGGSGQWAMLSRVASAAAVKEAQEWLRKAYIDGKRCKITGPSAIGTPGVLKSRYRFQKNIQVALEKAGASKAIAVAWDKAFKESWEQWAKKTTIPGLPFYPAFSAFPGAQAPPMPNVPVPLGSLVSSGSSAMAPPVLAQKVLSRLGSVAKHQKVKNAANGFATDLSKRFATCMAGCVMGTVMGSGPVPSFAPPAVPLGPVLNGICTGGHILSTVGFD